MHADCVKPLNGMAQWQRRDRRNTYSIIAHFWKTNAVMSGAAAVRLELVLGGFMHVYMDLLAMAHPFASLLHIPEPAGHHVHGFASRRENLPV
jgi:hypothetical protein